MPNFNCLRHCVQDKMQVSQKFTDTPRMTVGHTKSLCDGCFDLFRINIRSECHCYQQLNTLVNTSAVCNEVFDIPFYSYDWDSYFNRSLTGLS